MPTKKRVVCMTDLRKKEVYRRLSNILHIFLSLDGMAFVGYMYVTVLSKYFLFPGNKPLVANQQVISFYQLRNVQI